MASSPKVTVKQGCIVGGTGILPNGNKFNFFKGIPYAEPPVGKLRFKAPVPLESFRTPEIECIQEGNISFQRNRITGHYTGSEDCLFLNVYTPQNSSSGELLPVMVYIHGGAFLNGSGNSESYNPLYLMQENVVVVTMNYRLGPLGFLSFPDGKIPGNAGLKDQRLALQWVQENISQFGGDNKNVTLFGQSAGGLCTHLHVLSKESRKYFHKAIMQSGLANMTWLMESKSSEKTIKLAKSLGCHSSDPNEIADFLQQHNDIKDFFDPVLGLPNLDYNDFGFIIPTKPTIEEDSSEAVCTKATLESMRNNTTVDIPLIFGCCSADGSVVFPAFVGMLEKLEHNLKYFIPDEGGRLKNTKDLESAIKKFYFQGQKIDITSLSNLLTDFYFMSFTTEAAECHLKNQKKSPLYFYIFDFVGDLNLHKKKYKLENVIEGAAHADETNYIFQPKSAPEPWNERDKRMVESICKMWTNFAKNSNPSAVGCDWKEVPKNQKSEDFFLKAFIFNDEMQMVENPLGERMKFWRDLRKTIAGLVKQN